MYESIYTLIRNAVFNTAVLTGYQELFLVLVSSTAVLTALLIPFYIVYRLIRLLFR